MDNTQTSHVVRIHDVSIDQEYTQWLGEVKARYRNAQISLDLQAAFPEAKGFSVTNLWRMKQWILTPPRVLL